MTNHSLFSSQLSCKLASSPEVQVIAACARRFVTPVPVRSERCVSRQSRHVTCVAAADEMPHAATEETTFPLRARRHDAKETADIWRAAADVAEVTVAESRRCGGGDESGAGRGGGGGKQPAKGRRKRPAYRMTCSLRDGECVK